MMSILLVKTCDLLLLCHLLHALIHLLVCCHVSLCLVLKFQAPIHETTDLQEMIDYVICAWRPLFRALVVS